jgi:hypothetical protein
MTKCTSEFQTYLRDVVVPEMSYLAEMTGTTEARESGMVRIALSHWNFVKGGDVTDFGLSVD